MTAEIVSVGTEILLGQIVDTNAPEAGRVLAEYGCDHQFRQTVGDNLERLTQALRLALSRSDIVLTIGGLGPTEDDLTRDGIAAALEDTLVVDDRAVEHLKEIFRKRGMAWIDSQLRQAMRPTCAEPILNENGTAPGCMARKGGKLVIALPGPKNEFVPMLKGPVAAAIAEFSGGGTIGSRMVRVVGIGEAALERQLADLLAGQPYTLAPYAKVGEVHLRATVKAQTQAEVSEILDQAVLVLQARLGDAIYAVGDTTLPEAVINLLVKHGKKLATAESLTGGAFGAELTTAEGASRAYVGGAVTYSNEMKHQVLGVPVELLTAPEHGAVSAATAVSMADGARRTFGTDFAVSLTGVAGVEQFEENGVVKPNGEVFIGIAGGSGTVAHRFLFLGGRETVRLRSVQTALALLRTVLLKESAGS